MEPITMMTVQISDDLFKIVQNLAAQKDVSVDRIVEDVLMTSFQSQIGQPEINTSSVKPFDPEFDSAYHVAKSMIARYKGLVFGRILQEQKKPNPNQELITKLEAEEEEHKEAGWRLSSKTTEELKSLAKKYADLANIIRDLDA